MASETIKRVRLGEVFDLQMGKTPARADSSFWGGGHKWISIADIGKADVYISETKETISDAAISASGIRPIPKDTLIMSFKLSIGKVAITAEEMFSNEAIMSFRDLGKHELDLHYLFHQFKNKDWSGGMNKAVMGATLNKASLKCHEILLHPLPAQRRIAAALDKISEMKRNAEARLQKLDLLVKARFNELFGDGAYEEKELSAVTTFIDYRGKTPTKSESGVPLITAKNVRSFGFSIEPREYIPEEMYLGWMTRGFPAVGDVLFTTEAPLGNVCRIPNVYDKFAVGQRIVTMQPHRDILDATYLEFALRSGAFQRKVFEKSSGSTVTGIRSKLLEKLALPLPPLSLQRSFAAFVEKVEALKATAQASLARVDLLYRAKLQEYFG